MKTDLINKDMESVKALEIENILDSLIFEKLRTSLRSCTALVTNVDLKETETVDKMKDDLIYRSAAIHTLERLEDLTILEIREALKTIPAERIEKSVRCRDCALWHQEEHGLCENWSFIEDHRYKYTQPDDFCSYGFYKNL